MAAILNDSLTIMQHDPTVEDIFGDDYEYKLSLWVKEKDIIRPSGEISLIKTLEPGMYTVEYSRDLGYFCKKIKLTSDTLYSFSDSLISELVEEVKIFWEKEEEYNKLGLMHKRGILFEGPPGTGKTCLIAQLCEDLIKRGGIVFIVSGYKNMDYYMDFVTSFFRKIQPDTPIITILEDLNQYEEVESQILDFFDGKFNINHHLILTTSNNTEEIPDSFLRPSRIDLRVEVLNPSEIVRKEYFLHKNIDSEILDTLVEKTKGLSLASLKEVFICILLLNYSVEDAISRVKNVKRKRDYSNLSNTSRQIGILKDS